MKLMVTEFARVAEVDQEKDAACEDDIVRKTREESGVRLTFWGILEIIIKSPTG